MARSGLESDMADPVAKWLRAQGLRVYPEEMQADFIATDDVEVVVVEMKRSLTQGVLAQLVVRQETAHRLYAAVPTAPRAKGLELAKLYGYGVLAVDGADVRELLPAVRASSPHRVDRVLQRLRDKPEPKIVVSGTPMLKGQGPRQKLASVVAAFFQDHPNASWREAFAAVPNHYGSWKSFAQCLGHARRCV